MNSYRSFEPPPHLQTNITFLLSPSLLFFFSVTLLPDLAYSHALSKQDTKTYTNQCVPDIVCMTEDGEARIIRDVKTLWTHNLDPAMADPEKRRAWLGLLTPRYIIYLENRELMTTCFLRRPASTIYVPRQGTIPSPCPNCKTTPVAPLEQDIIFTQQKLDCTLHLIGTECFGRRLSSFWDLK